MAGSSHPMEDRLKQALPELAHHVITMHQDVKQELSIVKDELTGVIKGVGEFISSKLNNVTIQFGGTDATTNAGPVSLPTSPLSHHNGFDIDDDTPKPPEHKMSRAITTVKDLWADFSVGIAGGPSIQGLESRWKAKWRKGAETQFYLRRKVIIDRIKFFISSHGLEESVAIAKVDEEKGDKSLDALGKHLKIVGHDAETLGFLEC